MTEAKGWTCPLCRQPVRDGGDYAITLAKHFRKGCKGFQSPEDA
jgi:hypothetical protein